MISYCVKKSMSITNHCHLLQTLRHTINDAKNRVLMNYTDNAWLIDNDKLYLYGDYRVSIMSIENVGQFTMVEFTLDEFTGICILLTDNQVSEHAQLSASYV